MVALEASAFIGFLFPGEIACILGGVLAFQGRVSLAAAMAAAIGGAIIGDSVGYGIGHRYGERLLRRLPARLVKPHHIDQAKSTVSRLGGKAVFVGRFTAALRVLVPGMCGIARMPYRTFLVYNVAGGVVWAGGSVLLGYVAGAGWRKLDRILSLGVWRCSASSWSPARSRSWSVADEPGGLDLRSRRRPISAPPPTAEGRYAALRVGTPPVRRCMVPRRDVDTPADRRPPTPDPEGQLPRCVGRTPGKPRRASYRAKAGSSTASTPQPATHRMPPEITDVRTLVSVATAPASTLPSSGPVE